MNVGDLVRIKKLGVDCFIEEIVLEPSQTLGKKDGLYSLFGLVPQEVTYKTVDWYYGDYRGSDLILLGRKMSKAELIKYKDNLKDSPGLAEDIDKVIINMYGSEVPHVCL